MRSIKAASLSAVLSMAAYCTGLAIYGTYPFGSHSRAMNDLRNQYVPFHVGLWDLLHGVGHNSLSFNWNSSYGVGFLGEYFTYLANPFSLLVGLFPRNEVDFPVFLVSVLSMGLGAAMMTVFLGRLQPGSGWLRALLSVGYALCGWSVLDGSIVPMWMFGLAALPMLCIAADWCLQGRRWVAGTLVVGLCWYANFYVAAMAMIGATLVLLLRLLLAEELDLRDRLRVLWRAATMSGVGLMLAAPAILVSGLASGDAQPSESYVISVAVGPLDYLAKFLPGVFTPTVNRPNVFVGVLVLLLVLVLPFQRRVPVRARIGWLALIVLTAVSFTVHTTALVWQGFAIPHGVPWRETFVLSGFMVMAAWLALANRPDRRAVLGGGGLLALLALVTVGTHTANRLSWALLGVGGVLAVGALVVLGREGLAPARRRLVCGLLTVGVFAGGTLAVYNATDLQGYTGTRTTLNSVTSSGYAAVKSADAWPQQRFDVGSDVFVTDNDPILMDSEGGSFYSSYIPAVTATALQKLGLPWAMAGRHISAPSDPVSQALLSVGRTLTAGVAGGRSAGTVSVKPSAVPPVPLVTVHTGDGTDPHGAPTGTVWADQQALLGATVYQVPRLGQAGPAAAASQAALGGVGGSQAYPVAAGSPATYGFQCRAGSAAFLYAPYFQGTVTAFGKARTLNGAYPVLSTGVRFLGDVPASGRGQVAFTTARAGQQIPEYAVGCLSLPALKAATAASALTAPTALQVQGGHLQASFPAGTTGTAVVAATDVKGWTCSVNGGAAKTPTSYAGMLGVPLAGGGGAQRIACDYTPPGLTPGLAGSAAGCLAVMGVLAVTWWRRRRRPAEPLTAPAAPHPTASLPVTR
ncbi:YfhO family protein [Streptacidiphilus neutrinimicus]|uniref:YfhO family protein n=1 Tax=Streptacidiphilus neutrinimicus TaxID=105420 RepID=UPI000694D089|nr:YfhO family protein [Streptacidiphilus neutrinimicus]